jgi:hypothetical protein
MLVAQGKMNAPHAHAASVAPRALRRKTGGGLLVAEAPRGSLYRLRGDDGVACAGGPLRGRPLGET